MNSHPPQQCTVLRGCDDDNPVPAASLDICTVLSLLTVTACIIQLSLSLCISRPLPLSLTVTLKVRCDARTSLIFLAPLPTKACHFTCSIWFIRVRVSDIVPISQRIDSDSDGGAARADSDCSLSPSSPSTSRISLRMCHSSHHSPPLIHQPSI